MQVAHERAAETPDGERRQCCDRDHPGDPRGRVVDAGRDAGFVRGDGVHDDGGERRHGQRHAHADQQDAGQEARDVTGIHAGNRERREPRGGDERPGREHRARIVLADAVAGHGGA